MVPTIILPVRPAMRRVSREIMQRRIGTRGGIDESSIVLIDEQTIAPDSWEKPGHEFRSGGELYDVVGRCEVAGRRFLRCIADRLESKVEHAADNLSGAASPLHHSPNGKLIKSIADWLAGLFLQQPDHTLCCRAFFAQGEYGERAIPGWQDNDRAVLQRPPERI